MASKIKPYLPSRTIFDLAEKRLGIRIEEHELVIDDDAIDAALTRGKPIGLPELPEDPVERKKVYIDYIKRMMGGFHIAFARRNARIGSSSEAEAVHNIPSSSTVMAEEEGSGGLIKTGTLPLDSDSDSTPH